MSASYVIAQYVADVFRGEPRNVGVAVQRGGEVSARFFGEGVEGEATVIDGRRLRGFEYPDVYRQWVTYWRKQLTVTGDLAGMAEGSGGNYVIRPGGEVTDTGDDPIEDVANYLYSLLISEGGLAEAMGAVAIPERAEAALKRLVGDEFERANILARPDEDLVLVPHPVRVQFEVRGRLPEPHVPSFVQQNGRLYVMEPVDFTTRARDHARDHAAFASYMFDDIRAEQGGAFEAIALVRVRDEDREFETVRYGMAVLSEGADRLVDWFNDAERAAFVSERRRVALTHAG